MTSFFKYIQKLHSHPSVIYVRRDTDELYITNGLIFNEIFNHKKIPNDLEIYIIVKENKMFIETEDHYRINIE